MNPKGEGHKLLAFDVIKRKIRVNRAKRPPRESPAPTDYLVLRLPLYFFTKWEFVSNMSSFKINQTNTTTY